MLQLLISLSQDDKYNEIIQKVSIFIYKPYKAQQPKHYGLKIQVNYTTLKTKDSFKNDCKFQSKQRFVIYFLILQRNSSF